MKIAVVGSGTEAVRYVDALLTGKAHTLCAVIAPDAGVLGDKLKKNKIPTFATLKEFWEKDEAELIIVATPIGCHKDPGMSAVHHGPVLVAAPLMAEHVYGIDLKQEALYAKAALGVGESWCYTAAMQAAKQDIEAGKFGKAVEMSALAATSLPVAYYTDRPIGGKIIDPDHPRYSAYDCVLTDTAQPLVQALFYLNPTYAVDGVEMVLERANDIETFDTCRLRGATENGSRFCLAATNVADKEIKPTFCVAFEKGKIVYDAGKEDVLKAVMADGSEVVYGPLMSAATAENEINVTAQCLKEGKKLPCTADDVFPQLILLGTVFERIAEVAVFPTERVTEKCGCRKVSGIAEELKASLG